MTIEKEHDPETRLVGRQDQDDLLDGILREVVSREVAKKEGRDEGQSVVVEPIPDGESIVVGRREDLERFHEFLQQETARYRELEVEGFPTDPEKVEKVRRLLVPRLSKAGERLGLIGPPIVGELVRGALETAEDIAEGAGIPFEEKTRGGDDGERDLDELDKATDGFEASFR